MAAGPVSMAVVDNLLKEVYEDQGFHEQLNNEVITLRRIEKTTEGTTSEIGGKYTVFPIHTHRNHGIGARREGEVLPAARTNGWAQARVALNKFDGSIELTGETFELAETNPQTFMAALDAEMQTLKDVLARDMNRQVYGTNAGILATAASGTTTTFVLPNEQAIYLEMDMYVDLWDASGGAFDVNGPFTITNISEGAANTTVTFSPASANAVASGDTFRRYGNSLTATTGKELTGFAEIVSDSGTLYNIDPSSQPVWKATVDSNSGTNRALSEGLMIKMVHKIRQKGGSRPSVIFTSLGVQRAYFNLLSQQRQFVNTKTFAGGFEGLAFAGAGGEIPLIEDTMAPANKLWFISEKELKLYQTGDWKWMDRDGSKWKMKTNSQGALDVWFAHLHKYCELGTHKRNAHGLLSDITEG